MNFFAKIAQRFTSKKTAATVLHIFCTIRSMQTKVGGMLHYALESTTPALFWPTSHTNPAMGFTVWSTPDLHGFTMDVAISCPNRLVRAATERVLRQSPYLAPGSLQSNGTTIWCTFSSGYAELADRYYTVRSNMLAYRPS
ncbi:MAG TPA: hypothetical protein VFO38_05770 [Candidatus Saccharimonadales bacterium]|nr:hypothetical protein [Candidatus Saccharimonadales bacterium]